jgi:alpha-1,3-glucan synthase
MELYPDRVYSKPELTALPPYPFGVADFVLIPSRDERFGLVAVEFGWKGALCVGSRLGGLGLMPGWASASSHMVLYMFANDITIVVPCRVYFDAAHVIPVW